MKQASVRRALLGSWIYRSASSGLAAIVILLATNRAAAQSLAAEALFNEGRTLMDAGDYVHACPKLAESQRMDPGTGTLLNLGICYQKAGKTASAWGTFKEAAVLARRDNRADRVTYAQEQIALLEPGLSYLTVVVSDATKTIGLAVQVDGAALGEGAWGTAIPTDPGRTISKPQHRGGKRGRRTSNWGRTGTSSRR